MKNTEIIAHVNTNRTMVKAIMNTLAMQAGKNNVVKLEGNYIFSEYFPARHFSTVDKAVDYIANVFPSAIFSYTPNYMWEAEPCFKVLNNALPYGGYEVIEISFIPLY